MDPGEWQVKLVILESPFAGGADWALEYLRRAIRDCLERGESPYASHRMLTDALDDSKLDQRELGIRSGLEWHRRADYSVVYADYDLSSGMKRGIGHAQLVGLSIHHRYIGKNP